MKPICLLVVLLLVAHHLCAQGTVWKKEVSRLIDTRGNYMRHRKSDSSIAEVLANAARKKRVIVYSALEADFAKSISSYGVPYLFDNCIAPGAERSEKNYERFLHDSLYQFRIYEDWTFDKIKDTRIAIRYVAPIRNAYDEYGRYRGKQAIFLITYADFSRLLKQHPKLARQFNQALWNSYFGEQKTNNLPYDPATRVCTAKAMGRLPVIPQTTPVNFLRNEHNDSTLIDLIEHEVCNGHIPAWTNSKMLKGKQMTTPAVNDLIYPSVDAIVTIDPVTGNEIVQYTPRSSLYRTSHYYMLQNWTFDPATGITNISFNGLAPYDANYGRELGITGPIFWLQYQDVLPLINRLEQYQPEQFFSLQLWNNFFYSDEKPQLLK